MAMQAWTFFRGQWLEGNAPLLGAMDHATWLGSLVFDGARAFEGVMPDLDLHCRRVVRSAEALGLAPTHDSEAVLDLALEGVRRFPAGTPLYIRPMFFARDGFVAPMPETTEFALTVNEEPLPGTEGGSAALVSRRKPGPEMAPMMAKAACHYPQAGLAVLEAKRRGFGNAIVLDPLGHVAEFATANLFFARDGVVATPAANGTFLNGITRQRVIALLRADGVPVEERAVRPDEVLAADEVFSTGNYGKVQPYTRIEARDLQPGPFYARARTLYWDYAHSRH